MSVTQVVDVLSSDSGGGNESSRSNLYSINRTGVGTWDIAVADANAPISGAGQLLLSAYALGTTSVVFQYEFSSPVWKLRAFNASDGTTAVDTTVQVKVELLTPIVST